MRAPPSIGSYFFLTAIAAPLPLSCFDLMPCPVILVPFPVIFLVFGAAGDDRRLWQVISTARTCNMLLICLDVMKVRHA